MTRYIIAVFTALILSTPSGILLQNLHAQDSNAIHSEGNDYTGYCDPCDVKAHCKAAKAKIEEKGRGCPRKCMNASREYLGVKNCKIVGSGEILLGAYCRVNCECICGDPIDIDDLNAQDLASYTIAQEALEHGAFSGGGITDPVACHLLGLEEQEERDYDEEMRDSGE